MAGPSPYQGHVNNGGSEMIRNSSLLVDARRVRMADDRKSRLEWTRKSRKKSAETVLPICEPNFDGLRTLQGGWARVENLAKCASFVSRRVEGGGDEESVEKKMVRVFSVGAIRDEGLNRRDCVENGQTRQWRRSSSRKTRVSDGIARRGGEKEMMRDGMRGERGIRNK